MMDLFITTEHQGNVVVNRYKVESTMGARAIVFGTEHAVSALLYDNNGLLMRWE